MKTFKRWLNERLTVMSDVRLRRTYYAMISGVMALNAFVLVLISRAAVHLFQFTTGWMTFGLVLMTFIAVVQVTTQILVGIRQLIEVPMTVRIMREPGPSGVWTR